MRSDMLDQLKAFVNERDAIRVRKDILANDPCTTHPALTAAEQDAWGRRADGTLYSAEKWQLDYLSSDPILRNFRFCNIRREDDRVTRWIRKNIIEPYADHKHLWFMLAIARTLNWPPTLHMLLGNERSWPFDDNFNPKLMTAGLELWQSLGNKLHTGAYMIRAESHPEKPWFTWTKARYLSEVVLGTLWEARHDWAYAEPGEEPDSAGVWEYLQMFTGWGPFMAYQVVVDLQHTRYLRDARDVQTWAAAGPGTKRGLNRLWGAKLTAAIPPARAVIELRDTQNMLNAPGAIWPWLQPIDLSDVCNVMCEFDKYQRVKLGEGRPRALYKPETAF